MSDPVMPPNIPKFNFDPTKIMAALPSDKPRQSPLILLFGLLIIFLVVLAGWAYFYLVPQFMSPKLVLEKMKVAQAVIDSAHTSGHLQVSLSREPVATESLVSEEAGTASDATPISLAASESMVVKLEVGGDSLYEPEHRSAQSWSLAAYGLPENAVFPSRLNVKADIRLVGNDLYVRLREAPVLPSFDPAPWRSSWIKVTNRATIAGLFSWAELFAITERLPLETLEGVEAYHYRFTLNRPALKTLALNFLKLFEATASTPLNTSPLEVVLDNLQLPQGEIWIGRRDNLIYRVTLVGNIDKLEPISGRQYLGNYNLDWSFSGYNLPFEINPPTSFVNLEQVLNAPDTAEEVAS